MEIFVKSSMDEGEEGRKMSITLARWKVKRKERRRVYY